jgi:hypothetical protein
MQLELLEKLEGEDIDISCSLYLHPGSGKHIVWLKVGVALLQIPEEMLKDTIEVLRAMDLSIYLKENPE